MPVTRNDSDSGPDGYAFLVAVYKESEAANVNANRCCQGGGGVQCAGTVHGLEDWQVFFDERASIAEFDGGLSGADDRTINLEQL